MQIRWTISRAEQSRAEQSRAEHGLISALFAAQKLNTKTKAYSIRVKTGGIRLFALSGRRREFFAMHSLLGQSGIREGSYGK